MGDYTHGHRLLLIAHYKKYCYFMVTSSGNVLRASQGATPWKAVVLSITTVVLVNLRGNPCSCNIPSSKSSAINSSKQRLAWDKRGL